MKRIILLLAIIVTGMTQELQAQKAASRPTCSPTHSSTSISEPRWVWHPDGRSTPRGSSTAGRFRTTRRKHWVLQPEARYWLCDRFSGHFFGAHMHAGQYNVGGFNGVINLLGTDARKLKDYRYQGWFVGAGVAYGYAWILNRYWNLEAEIGFGYSYTRYDRFRCTGCGKKVETNKPHHYVGPTKAAINLVYVF